MELKEGMYVRYVGVVDLVERIGKIESVIPPDIIVIEKSSKLGKSNLIMKSSIVKTSYSITHLLKIGDIITFKNDSDVYRIFAIPNKKMGINCFYLVFENNIAKAIGCEDIYVSKGQMKRKLEFIVTKEQFEAMQYQVGE